MNRLVQLSTLVAACFSLTLGACKGSDAPKGKLSAADKPVEGDSCEGLDESDGVMACDGAKMLFCSSFSKYKWSVQETCAEGQSCSLAADGKGASCK
jgi:hypothetical protein